MAKRPDSGPVGNTDPGRRGRNLPRQDREQSQAEDEAARSNRPRGQKPNYGDVTKKD